MSISDNMNFAYEECHRLAEVIASAQLLNFKHSLLKFSDVADYRFL